MDGLMQFVQVDGEGRPEPLDEESTVEVAQQDVPWIQLQERARKLLHIR
jgi:hypothetical protein